MKKKKILIAAACIILAAAVAAGGVFAFKHFSGEKTINDKVVAHYDTVEEESFYLTLSDYTDFDWDFVLIYKFPITAGEISEALGFEYNNDHDLESGMIFIKSSEEAESKFDIVYEETFITDFEGPYEFVIYPYDTLNSVHKTRLFSKEQAVFKGKKVYYEGDTRYLFTPNDGGN